MLDETITIENTPDPTDSTSITMPSQALEAPRDIVTMPPVKDDNLVANEPETQVTEPVQTAQIELKPEQIQAPEAIPETGTIYIKVKSRQHQNSTSSKLFFSPIFT
jgi:hypothetical protein